MALTSAPGMAPGPGGQQRPETRAEARRRTRLARQRFLGARRAETQYAVQLRRIAQQVGHIVRGIFRPDTPLDAARAIETALRDYARLIGPWAAAQAERMAAEVARRDEYAWASLGREIGAGLRSALATAPIGGVFHETQAAQLGLITSLPREAAERVHGLAEEAMAGGRRWEEIAKDILASGEVTRSRANLIARTETARAQSNFTAVRAQHIGSELFQWMTAADRDVRPLHREIARADVGYGAGIYRWDDPPVLDDGRKGLPGGIWNCRCFASPLLPPL